jgi:hypothetical protein
VNRAIRPKFHPSFSKSEQGIVPSPPDKKSRLEAGSPLPDDNLAGEDPLASIDLDS